MNKINLYWRVPMDTEISILTTVPKLLPEHRKQLAQRPKTKKTHNFLRKKNSSKYSSRQLESSFQNPADFFWRKADNFYLKVLNCHLKFISFEKKTFLQIVPLQM